MPQLEPFKSFKKPSKKEREQAQASIEAFTSALDLLEDDYPEVEIAETKEPIRIPLHALRMLSDILKATAKGEPVSIVPIATEVTTQKAAEILGCSRPYLVSLLETGKIPFTKIGKHRRIMFEHVISYKEKMKAEQKQHLIEMMQADENDGLYDS